MSNFFKANIASITFCREKGSLKILLYDREVPSSKEYQFSIYRSSSAKNLDCHIVYNFDIPKYDMIHSKLKYL